MGSYQEKADTLAKRFGISPAEAMKALEECDGDILDAVSLLECKGIIKRTSASYRSDGRGGLGQSSGNSVRQLYRNTENPESYGFDSSNRMGAGGGLKDAVEKLWEICITYKIAAVKNEEIIIAVPVIVTAVLVLCAFPFTVSAAVIGLLAGCRYEIIK